MILQANQRPSCRLSSSSFTLLGSGKTAVDACVWLLDNDVPPDRIRWIAHERPGSSIVRITSLAQAGSIIEGLLLARLEASGRLSR